jgi:hypothetical protein
MMSHRQLRAGGHRGSVLIVALLLAALIALALGSYLSLNVGTARQARGNFQGHAAFHLAEAGAEEALWSYNQRTGGWTGWNTNGGAAWKKFTGFDLGGGTTGTVQVYVSPQNPSARARPTVAALATVTAPGMPASTRLLELSLSRRSYFGNGLVAKNTVTFSGARTSVDSWNSDPDQDPATAPVPYSTAVRRDQGSIATVALDTTAMLINQASVWGYVSTGGGAPQVGTQGSIRGTATPVGVQIDPARVSTDFTADFPPITAPTDGTPLAVLGATLGTAGQATKWRCPGITLRGNQTLTILGDVTLVLTAGSGTSALDVTGNAQLIIAAASSLTVYVEGDFKIAGNGVSNPNARPGTLLIYGTNTSASGQAVHLAGNGALKAVVYTPEGDVKINGNGDVMGAIVARTITLTGNADFHYDEALAESGTGTPFGVASWRELTTAADRARWQSAFQGW